MESRSVEWCISKDVRIRIFHVQYSGILEEDSSEPDEQSEEMLEGNILGVPMAALPCDEGFEFTLHPRKQL